MTRVMSHPKAPRFITKSHGLSPTCPHDPIANFKRERKLSLSIRIDRADVPDPIGTI